MEITFVSSLDIEQEERMASLVLEVLGDILDEVQLAYLIRIRTASQKLIERSHPALGSTRSRVTHASSSVS